MADFFPATLVERLGWTLVHSVWQFLLIALVAQAAARSLRGASPSLRHGVFLVALAAMLLGPLLTVSLVAATTVESPIAPLVPAAPPLAHVSDSPPAKRLVSEPQPSGVSRAIPFQEPAVPELRPVPQQPWWLVATESLRPWLDECVLVWCFGVLLFAVRPLLGWWTIQRLRTIGVSPVSTETQQLLERTARRLGLRRPVRILQSTLVNAPVVIGDWRPLILLPVTFATELPAAQVESILAHELAHIRRHDFLVNVCQTVVETLFFYHPAVWWVSSRLRIERENCCDDLAVEALGNRVEYGRALLAVAQFRGARPTLALGVADASLLTRVRRILGLKADDSGRRYAVGRWPAAVGVLSLLVSGGLLSMTWNIAAQEIAAREDVKPVTRISADADAGEHKATSAKLPNGVTVTLAGITKNTAPSSAGWRPGGGPMKNVAEWPSGLTLHDGNTVSRRDPKTVTVDEDAIDFLFEFGDLSVPPSLRFELPANGGSYSKDPLADPYRLRVSARKRDPAKLPPGATFTTPDGRVRVGYTDEPWGEWVKISPAGDVLNPPEESDRHFPSYRQIELLRAGASSRDPGLPSVVLQSPRERNELFDFQVTAVDDRGEEHWVLSLQSKVNDKSRTEEEWALAQALPEGRTLSHFAYRLRPYRYWVTFNNVALEPGANQEVSVEVTEVPAGNTETDPSRNEPAEPAADEAQATAPASTGFELRLVANLPDSKARPTVPEDWASRHYRDGRDGNLEMVKNRGFAWFPIAGKELTVPIDRTVGNGRVALLGDIHDFAMFSDDSWHVLACYPEESPSGTWSVRITLNGAGAERLAELTKTHLNQQLAIVVDGVIVAAPVIRNELGAQVEITGNFKQSDAERLAAAIRREIFKPFDCEIVDATTSKPIPGDGFTIHFLFKTPATADKPAETIDNLIWGPKSRSQFYFAIPKRTLRHPDRDRMIVHWGVSHPDYETLSDQKSAPLGQILRDDPKSARDQFRRIVMQPKKRAVVIEAPDGSKLEADTLRVSARNDTAESEGARLKIEYNIPGQEPEVRLYIQRVGSEEIGSVQEGGSRWTPLKNGATLDLKDLPEGVYHIARTRQVEVARAGTSAMHRILYIDRRIAELKSGQAQEIRFTRPTGRTVKGRIANLKDLKRDRALVRIVADEAEGAASPKALTREKMLDPETSKRERILDELKHPLFDARGCDAEGQFETEPLPPGKYVAVAEAYEITEERLRLSGIILPRWVGLTLFEVPAKGEVPTFEVTLEDAERQAANAQDDKAKLAAWEAEVYKSTRELEAMTGWVIAWDEQNPISHSDGKRMARLRVFPDGRVVARQGVRDPLAEMRLPEKDVAELVRWLIDDKKAGRRQTIRVSPDARKKAPDLPEELPLDPAAGPHWDQEISRVAIVRDGVTYDLVKPLPLNAKSPAPALLSAATMTQEVEARMWRLTALAVAGGPEDLARYAKFAADQLKLRHPATPLTITADALRGAGFDSDGTRAVSFEFKGDSVYPYGEMTIRVPPEGEPFVDDASYWTSETQGGRWGRKRETADTP